MSAKEKVLLLLLLTVIFVISAGVFGSMLCGIGAILSFFTLMDHLE